MTNLHNFAYYIACYPIRVNDRIHKFPEKAHNLTTGALFKQFHMIPVKPLEALCSVPGRYELISEIPRGLRFTTWRCCSADYYSSLDSSQVKHYSST